MNYRKWNRLNREDQLRQLIKLHIRQFADKFLNNKYAKNRLRDLIYDVLAISKDFYQNNITFDKKNELIDFLVEELWVILRRYRHGQKEN